MSKIKILISNEGIVAMSSLNGRRQKAKYGISFLMKHIKGEDV